MEKIYIQNDFFTREANPESELDRALLAKAAPGQTLIREELDEAARQRQTLYQAEMAQAAYIASRPKAYEREPFMHYVAAFSTLHVITRWARLRPIAPVSEELMPMVYDLQEQRKALKPIRDPEEGLWYIWGEKMPHSSVAETADWGMAFDRPDFRPFLIPYLLPDQSAVKGNIVVVSGGAYEWRSNRWEGYEAVERFNALGYNCFLLQRRVSPYAPLDGAMDLQRSLRYLRAHAAEFGIGAIDRIAVNGYSGGGWCVCDMLSFCYGDRLPSENYPDYVPDEIDRLNGDADAALLVYGVLQEPEQVELLRGNPALPPIFMVVGQDDFVKMDQGSARLYLSLQDRVPVELHLFAATGHGFGVGPSEDVSFADAPVEGVLSNVAVWPELADTFLKIRFGLQKQFEPKER